jgi:hypothetical protein
MTSDDIRAQGIFPDPTLPHPLQVNGRPGVPANAASHVPSLERFDVCAAFSISGFMDRSEARDR